MTAIAARRRMARPGQPEIADSRVLRGGSWFSNPQDLRAAVRGGSITVDRYGYIGFRVARTLNP